MTDYKRFEGETDEELIYRITGEKENIGYFCHNVDFTILQFTI